MAKTFNMVGGGGGIKLSSIAITTPPTKTAYKAGETFNPAGMVVTATYSNGLTMTATGIGFEPSTPLLVGTTSVTIRYSEAGVTRTAAQAISVTKTAVPVPTQSESLTYSGSVQSPMWNNYDDSKMTLGGVTSAANAGSYNATFTLQDTDIYEWNDNTTTPKTVAWAIGKAAGSVTLDKSSITLNSGNPSDTITVTRLGDGAITAQSSDTGIATVSVSGNVVTIQSVDDTSGNVTVTVNVASGTNYAAASTTASVAAQFPIKSTCVSVATSGAATVTDLNLYTPATINSIAKKIAKSTAITSDTTEVYATLADGNVMKLSANGASASQVTIQMNSTNYAFDIIGFNHDEDDNGKVGITFQMHDLFTTTYPMKSSMTSTDGWHNSDLRNTTMPLLMGYMPAAWQNILVAVNKQTCQDVSTATLNTTRDKLFVPSEWEVFGENTYSKAQEGTQYVYYKNGGTKVKKRNGSAAGWWERSPYLWYASFNLSGFCIVDSNGNSKIDYAFTSIGAAPCFCLGSAAYAATTTIPSGSQIQAGITGLNAGEIKKIANAISANSAINNETSVCYVDTGAGYYTISIGDQISWTMNRISFPYRIMGFNHYDKADGSGKAGILFQMVDLFNNTYPVVESESSASGWDDSDMRTTLNSTLYGYLPSDVQSAISQVAIKTAQDVSTSTIITTDDKLFLPAEVEVFGSTRYAIGGTNEGVWYPWYKANNNPSSRIKKNFGTASNGDWCERSPYNWLYDRANFCSVNSGGYTSYYRGLVNHTVAPCFCF